MNDPPVIYPFRPFGDGLWIANIKLVASRRTNFQIREVGGALKESGTEHALAASY
jgi:hypothetical protein